MLVLGCMGHMTGLLSAAVVRIGTMQMLPVCPLQALNATACDTLGGIASVVGAFTHFTPQRPGFITAMSTRCGRPWLVGPFLCSVHNHNCVVLHACQIQTGGRPTYRRCRLTATPLAQPALGSPFVGWNFTCPAGLVVVEVLWAQQTLTRPGLGPLPLITRVAFRCGLSAGLLPSPPVPYGERLNDRGCENGCSLSLR